MKLIRFLMLIVGISKGIKVSGQDSTLVFNMSVSSAISTGVTPFWQHANQNGIIPINKAYALGSWGIRKIYNPQNPRLFQWSGGAQFITSYSTKGNVFFTDLYLAAKLGNIEFLVGQKSNIAGLVDTTLTSGSLPVSGNSRPIPGIKILIPNFLPLNFTNGYISIMGSYSDGRLGNSMILYGSTPNVPKTYFHQKQLYIRLGHQDNRIHVYAGINHQVVWGGENKISPLYNLKGIDEYWYVISGKTLDYKKVGNHFGTYDIAAEFKTKEWSYFLYRQNIYENGSLFKVINFTDGLSGLSLHKNHPIRNNSSLFEINAIAIEVIGTSSQRNEFSSPPLNIYETGNYFNHYIYQRGWSYYGRTIGTPLISQKGILNKDLNNEAFQSTDNNRLWAFHTSIAGVWLQSKFIFKGTYSRNFGTYLRPFGSSKDQFSLFLNIEKKVSFLHGLNIFGGISSDLGKLYPQSTGIYLGLKKSGYL